MKNNIKTLRKSKKLSQTELGEKIGATKQQICFWEKGVYNPQIKNLQKIADALEVSVNDLIK